jgi:Protein of unknown function (DUF2808)
MRIPSYLSGLAVAITLGSIPLLAFLLPTQAVELRDGKTYFLRPPSLVNAATTENRVSDSNASYFFTLYVPEGAGEPLQRIEITQRDGSIASRLVQFEAENSRAFLGTRRDRGEPLQLGETRYDRDSQTISVAFKSPIPPNSTVTLELRPERNPLRDGIIWCYGLSSGG